MFTVQEQLWFSG